MAFGRDSLFKLQLYEIHMVLINIDNRFIFINRKLVDSQLTVNQDDNQVSTKATVDGVLIECQLSINRGCQSTLDHGWL